MTFGAQLPNGKHSYPTSPSWVMYGGDDTQCVENVPLLIRREIFCQAFLAESRVFRCVSPFSFPSCVNNKRAFNRSLLSPCAT
jgi:hypothetical protein